MQATLLNGLNVSHAQTDTNPSAIIAKLVASVDAVRKNINSIGSQKTYQGRLLKDVGTFRNPCRLSIQGFTVVACQFADGNVLIQATDAASWTESGMCQITLAQIGAQSYKKLLRGLLRGVLYKKDGALCIALFRKNNKPFGAVSLTPMTEDQRVRVCGPPKPKSR